METAVRRMAEDLNERGPFLISFDPLVLNQPHPGDQKAYTIRVQFPEQGQPQCRLKVEITIDEPILSPVETGKVLHGFPEEFIARVPGYSLSEITAEKFRALLQSKAKLRKRGWGASRVCRDYYDLWNLLQYPGIVSPDLILFLKQKCAVRNVSFDTPHDFISEDLLAVASLEWQKQLLPFVPDAPPVTELLGQVQTLILSVWE